LDFSILSSLLPAEIRGHIRRKDIAMKKLALLSAVMTLGISSWAFAADNPPPPPEKGAQHQGKPPAKNGQHDGKQAQHNGKQPQRDGKQPQQTANSRSMVASAAARQQPQKAASTAGNRCRQKRNPSGLAFCARLFSPSSADIDKLLPFFDKPIKNLHSAWHSKPTPLIRREKVC
jgi:hypothetical protein